MKKTLSCLLLAGSMLLTACGSSGKKTETTTDAGLTSRRATAEATASSVSADTASADSDITVPLKDGDLRAMLLVDPDGNQYFVDIHSGSFFTTAIPDNLTDETGAALSQSDLTAGDILDITGDGIMLESYPGQYPGVTKMVRVKDGTPEDAAVYADLIDSVYRPADPSERPFLNADYEDDLAATTVMLTEGNYDWTYTKADGTTATDRSSGSHILEWDTLNDTVLAAGTQVYFRSSSQPAHLTVTRFPISLWKGYQNGSAEGSSAAEEATIAASEAEIRRAAEQDNGEEVPVSEDESGFYISADPDYVYLISATWPSGTIEYGFYTRAQKTTN